MPRTAPLPRERHPGNGKHRLGRAARGAKLRQERLFRVGALGGAPQHETEHRPALLLWFCLGFNIAVWDLIVCFGFCWFGLGFFLFGFLGGSVF